MKASLSPILLLSAIVLGGCGTSPENRYYLPQSASRTASAGSMTSFTHRTIVVVDQPRTPDLLDRPQIVVRSAGSEIALLDFDRWASPLPEMILHTFSEDLQATIGTAALVSTGAAVPGENEIHVLIDIEEFDWDSTGNVQLRTSWSVLSGTGHVSPRQRFRQVRSTDPKSLTAGVTSRSMLLDELSRAVGGTVVGELGRP